MGSEKELKMGSVRPIQETRHKNQPTTKHKNHAVLYELSAVYIRVAHKSSWASDGGGGGGKWAVGSEPKDHYRTLALDIGEDIHVDYGAEGLSIGMHLATMQIS
jgi:hypothetical protein